MSDENFDPEQKPIEPKPENPFADQPVDPGAEMQPGQYGEPISAEARQFGMLAHILGIVAGFVGPLIIWLVKKDEHPFVDDQGKEALNFQLTMVIGYFINGLLMIVCIGYLTLPAQMIFNLIFCIIGGMAANEGKWYRYPLNIRFIQ